MHKPRSQKEIQSSWICQATNPLVSICCFTFNHEEFIEDALFGFLAQVTDFPFEIVIHDDASTDGTTSILKKYTQLYPDIIRLIVQARNQFSIYPNKPFITALNACNGSFIALCEGDDYWICEDKLSIQYEYISANSECSLVFHSIHRLENGIFDGHYYKKPSSMYLSQKDIILHHYIPTCSTMFRASWLLDEINSVQNIKLYPVADIPYEILVSGKGYVYYMDICMGVYRLSPRSLTQSPTHLKSARLKMTWMYIDLFHYVIPQYRIFVMYVVLRLQLGYLKVVITTFVRLSIDLAKKVFYLLLPTKNSD